MSIRSKLIRAALLLQRSSLISPRRRRRLLSFAGARIAADSRVSAGLHISPRLSLTIEPGVYVNVGCFFDDEGEVTIGQRVHVGPHCRLLTTSHELGLSECRAGPRTVGAVHIGEGAWLGANVTVLPNVTVAPGCVIAAGAVVTRSTEPDGVYAGVPARRVRDL